MIVDSYPAGIPFLARRSDYVAAIDGLRALSVLSVLAYHVNAGLLPGGFVGVDVFFVISGFVVSRSLLHYPPSGPGTFVAKFYRRRILRIVPALLLCLLTFMLLSALLVPIGGLSQDSDYTGIAAIFGVSNVALWRLADDYFAPTNTFNPFTHTWSLGVEEQFYFVFPLIFFGVLAAARRSDAAIRRAILLFGIAGGLSLLASAAATARNPDFAFYMLVTRFWELGAGVLVLLAVTWLAESRRMPFFPEPTISGLAILALAALVFAFVAADADRFPFPWALPPVLAAALLCGLVTLWPEGRLSRALSVRPLVFFGKLSYSLYLWHFGVIVLFRWTLGIDAAWQQAVAAAISVAMAVMSYYLVERPIRFSPRLTARSDGFVISRALGMITAAAALAGALLLARPYISLSVTRDPALWSMTAEPMLIADGCQVESAVTKVPGGMQVRFTPVGCEAPTRPRRVVAIGDSHAGAYQVMLQRVAAHERTPVEIYQAFGCPVFRFFAAPAKISPACRAFLDNSLAELSRTLAPGDVLFLPALRMPRFRTTWGAQVNENGDVNLEPVPADLDAAAAIFDTLRGLLRRDVAIVVEAPKPIFRVAPFRCVDWFTVGNAYCAPGFKVARTEIETRRARSMRGIVTFAAMAPGITVWDPLPILCPEAICSAFRDGKPLFVDGDHLGPAGNLLLLSSFLAHLDGLG